MAASGELRAAPAGRWPRALLLGLLIGLHAALLLLPRQVLHVHHQRPLALIYLPQPKAATPETIREKTQRVPPRALSPRPISAPRPASSSAAPATSPPIDWDSEAAITLLHQEQLTNAPQARSLDDHKGHDHQDGMGLSSHEAPQFGWDDKAIHRFDTRGAVPVIHLSDRCVLPLGPMIPLPICGFGKKIEARGDLFEHMRDPPAGPQP